jgi:hypothetical protein
MVLSSLVLLALVVPTRTGRSSCQRRFPLTSVTLVSQQPSLRRDGTPSTSLPRRLERLKKSSSKAAAATTAPMPVPRLASAATTLRNETLAPIQFRRSHPLHATTRCTRRRRQIWMPRPRYHISPSDLAEWA